MLFMTDSERAADLAKKNGLDVRLHLNFTDRFTSGRVASKLANHHNKIAGCLTRKQVFAGFLQSFAAKGILLLLPGTGRGV